MYARSMVAVLAATATLALGAAGMQASPSTAIGDLGAIAEKSLSKVGYEICDATTSESYCRLITDTDESDEDEEPNILDLLGDDDDDDDE